MLQILPYRAHALQHKRKCAIMSSSTAAVNADVIYFSLEFTLGTTRSVLKSLITRSLILWVRLPMDMMTCSVVEYFYVSR